ncbi:MAG: ROK family protein [Planctomycetota bacterium]|nr:ROK family protein [Planctomycetota bacterium]
MDELYAGVDLGGTTIACALATRDGQIVCEATVPTQSHEGPVAVLERISTVISSLVFRAGRPPNAVGMGIPGLVDLATGVTKFLPNLPTQWRDVPAAAILGGLVGCPVHLLNDVRTATLGELRYGHGKAVGTMAFFSLGTGVGGGVAIDGKLRLGPLGAAGELGHQTIVPDGPRCGCGNRGCLETLASGPAITAEGIRLLRTGLAPKLYELVGGDVGRVTPAEMAEAATAGDQTVREAILRAAEYLGIGVANVVTILHPELVVLGGGVAAIGDLLLERVRQVVRERVGMFPTEGVRVEQSLLGAQAGVLGAIALAAEGVGVWQDTSGWKA